MLISSLFLFQTIKGVDNTCKWFSEARLYLRWLLFTPTIKFALASQGVCSCEVSLPKKGFLAGGFSGVRSQCEGRFKHMKCLVMCWVCITRGQKYSQDMLQFCIPRQAGWRESFSSLNLSFFKQELTFDHSPVLLLIWRPTWDSKRIVKELTFQYESEGTHACSVK